MKKIFNFILIILFIGFSITFFACSDDTIVPEQKKEPQVESSIKTKEIFLDSILDVKLVRGDSILAFISKKNADDSAKVEWLSSNEDIITVDSIGKILCLSTGKATITATVGEKVATLKVEVYIAVSSVELNKKSISLTTNDVVTLSATVFPSDATYKNVTFSTNDETIVQVDSAGKIKAISVGETTITAKAEEKIATCKVVVRIDISLGLQGKFSVSETKKIRFSHGNLQYNIDSETWQFAENQYDISKNKKNIDLFCWGTGNNPTASSNLSTFTDWGENFGDGNTWFTLSKDEWEYLLTKRQNAEKKYGVAQVNGVNGLILLSDDWALRDGLMFKNGVGTSENIEYQSINTYNINEWLKMEQYGAVFLPASGSRVESDINYVNHLGGYWTCTPYNDDKAYDFYFYSFSVGFYDSLRAYARAVRLVRQVE